MRKLTLGLALLASSCMGPPAYAQGARCAPVEAFLASAEQKYHERPVFIGTAVDGSTLLIVASASGTFTVVRVSEEVACYIVDGGSATTKPLPLPGSPS